MEQNLHTNRKQEGAREVGVKEDISTCEKKTESAILQYIKQPNL